MIAPLLRGVDLAAFCVALAERLRTAGVAVPAEGAATLTRALRLQPPRTRNRLYWAARLTLVDRHDGLAVFDAVFSEVFDHGVLPMDPHARRTGPEDAPHTAPEAPHSGEPHRRPGGGGAEVPWVTRTVAVADRTPPRTRPGEALPSALAGAADQRFSDLDPTELAALGARLEQATVRWLTRPTRRRVRHHAGRVDLRASISASRRTGFEPVRLLRTRPGRRRRRLVVFCDVSRSMRGYADIYLHLMRAAVRGGDAEIFVFSTTATRLTTLLAQHSVDRAIETVNARVDERFGGTCIAGSLADVLGSHRGHLLRGAIVVLASDGWDSDDPAELAQVMGRVRRRAHRVVWLNPRAGLPGFTPTTASMAAALPYCDALLPADTLRALREAIDVITGPERLSDGAS
ncbi:VWA domain-containing protein [Rhodococcus chondri]|uniref:VWA domain-containing protein n=1 Tax=Rhodococcus chondri TaxID=3065941 RepID=A0ABU7JPA2_9NOCA|nr:VWA domain-containing protein [Rhodococcus sp. CC-R104]MEE2031871.1 VWA domain-containing protein [Rhodococcus sp. CC-R104]